MGDFSRSKYIRQLFQRDNFGVVLLTANPVIHSKINHFEQPLYYAEYITPRIKLWRSHSSHILIDVKLHILLIHFLHLNLQI